MAAKRCDYCDETEATEVVTHPGCGCVLFEVCTACLPTVKADKQLQDDTCGACIDESVKAHARYTDEDRRMSYPR